MYDLVGDKIRDIFDAQIVTIGIYDFDAEVTHYPYAIEMGGKIADEVAPITANTRRILALFQETGKPLVIPDVEEFTKETDIAFSIVAGSEPAKSIVFAPLITSGKVFGRISLQNLDRYDAFSRRPTSGC